MKVTVLGCGTSTGVPMPGCKCRVCSSTEPRNHRLRTSLWVQGDKGESVIIDTGPDFRTQALRAKIPHLDAVFYTHTHADHVFGFPDIRTFNWVQQKPVELFATQYSASELRRVFSYAFDPAPDYIGGGLPKVNLRTFEIGEVVRFGSLEFQTFLLIHGNTEVVGFRLGDFVYATDCKEIPDTSKTHMRNARTLVIDGLRPAPEHPTHLTLSQAQEMAKELGAATSYATHMSHDVDYLEVTRHLPNNFRLAYDGLEIHVT